jgi:Patatin-like phospholipase
MADRKRYRHNPSDPLYGGADAIVEKELEHLQAWRGCAPRHGLALSGGGIRSASYCLGVLQALANRGVLDSFDYLSTVSGGGYSGTSVSYLLHEATRQALADGEPMRRFDASRAHFPYLSHPMVSVPPADQVEQFREKGRLLHRLRQNAKYLTAGSGITLLSLIGSLLRNLLASTLVHGAVLLLALMALIGVHLLPDTPRLGRGAAGFPWPELTMLQLAWGSFLLFVAGSLAYVALTGFFNYIDGRRVSGDPPSGDPPWRTGAYRVRRAFDVGSSWLLAITLACLAVGALPWVLDGLMHVRWHDLAKLFSAPSLEGANKPVAVGSLAALLGLLGNVWGLLQTRGDKKPLIPTQVLVIGGSALLLFGVLLLLYMLALWSFAEPGRPAEVVGAALLVLVALGWWPDANHVSLHRFYRDRLMELFMPDLRQVTRSVSGRGAPEENMVGWSVPGDQTLLADLCGVALKDRVPASTLNGPYHLINANVVLVASKHPLYRGRGGDNFILSPLVCGSRATGWADTVREPGKGLTAATAMAISGAAVNPNAGGGGEGITRQPLLSVLMGILNVRLGYWFDNPGHGADGRSGSKTMNLLARLRPNLLSPGLAETLARESLNEHEAHVLLTDGGHFENLGLYELVRRRLSLIVVCDATADKDFTFTDLANAIEKVRSDFGALIDITREDLATLVPREAADAGDDGIGAVAERGYLVAPITYSRLPGEHAEQKGQLVLLKATFFKALSADLHSYRRTHPDFPNQSTGDQFFDEKQFEAYRELGFMTCWGLLQDLFRDEAPPRPSRASPIDVEAFAWFSR